MVKKFTNNIFILIVIGLVVLGIGCSVAAADQQATPSQAHSISVKGSDSVLPLAQAEAEEFMHAYPEKSV